MDRTVHAAEEVSFFRLASQYHSPKPLHRCFSLARLHHVRTVVEERLEHDEVTRKEVEEFGACGMVLARQRTRIAFSKADEETIESATGELPDCIGWAIIHEDHVTYEGVDEYPPRTYVAEAVIEPPRNDDYFLLCKTDFTSVEEGCTCEVGGALFVQQPGHLGCCAHAALLVVARTFGSSDVDLDYLGINGRLGLNIPPDFASDRGLYPKEIANVLSTVGLQVRSFAYSLKDLQCHESLAEFKTTMAEMPLQQVVYHAVESGFPVILGFQGVEGHVVVVVGHVFDGHTWLAEAERAYFELPSPQGGAEFDSVKFLRSSLWTRNFVIMDDNFGPYYFLSAEGLEEKVKELLGHKGLHSGDDHGLIVAMVVTPKDCPFLAPEVETKAVAYLYQHYPVLAKVTDYPASFWGSLLLSVLRDKRPIVRTVRANRESYMRHMRDSPKYSSDHDSSLRLLERLIPEEFWLVEASIPELYTANSSKLADIFVTGSTVDELRVVAIRFPEYMSVVGGDEDEVLHYRSSLAEYYGLYETGKNGLHAFMAAPDDA